MPPMPLDTHRLVDLLGPLAGRFDVDCLASIDSTNSELLRRAAAPAGSVLVAERQTAGRGRRGRPWLAQPGDALTFSLLWRFADPQILSGLSLAVGVAIARALEKLGVSSARLKWPNDILLADGKLAGVLIELQADGRGMRAVIGIGINRRLPPAEALPPGLVAASLADVLPELPTQELLLATLLIALTEVLDPFAREGFAAFQDEWQIRHAWNKRPVRVLFDDGRSLAGTCLGVAADGALLLEGAHGIERLLSGDLSLRPA